MDPHATRVSPPIDGTITGRYDSGDRGEGGALVVSISRRWLHASVVAESQLLTHQVVSVQTEYIRGSDILAETKIKSRALRHVEETAEKQI